MSRKLFAIATGLAVAVSAAWAGWWSSPSWNSNPPPPPPPAYGQNYYWYDQAPPSPPPPSSWYDDRRPPRDDWRDDDHHRHHDHDRDRDRGRHSHGGKGLVGEFSAEGGAKEVSIGGGRKSVVIEIVSGPVSFNTIVLRRGSQKESVTISRRFNAGEQFSVPVDAAVTGLRISCGGKGRFRVYAR